MGEFIVTIKSFLPTTRVEAVVMGIGSSVGAIIATLVGGWDNAIQMLTVLVILDYITGLWAAFKNGEASSKRGFDGVLRKIAIYIVVAFGFILDGAMQINILRSMVIFAYAANEGISILENVDKLGYGKYIPPYLRDKIEELKREKTRVKNGR